MLFATAGHVDHGKTTLVRALTGVETDRLKEEKARGLSIDLGFAYIDAPNGESIGFVDVPGHEKFIRNMAVGVAAVDLALLIVAADDGVMPQTREHAAILGLFGIKECIVVITRIDLVSEATDIKAASDASCDLLLQNGIECRSVHRVSSVTGAGIAELKKELFDFVTNVSAATVDQSASDKVAGVKAVSSKIDKAEETGAGFRLALDRSFSVPGAGTIVTGTVYNGSMKLGDSLQHLPSRTGLRIKKVHVNGREASESDRVQRGHRVSINVANLGASEIERGDWMVAQSQSVMTDCIDALITVLDDEPARLKHWSKVHVHFAASSLTARVSLYERRHMEPGESAMAQLVLARPVHTVYGDRLILRDSAATRTLGGAKVIQPFSSRLRKYRKNRVTVLLAQNNDDPVIAMQQVLEATDEGINADQFRQGRNLPLSQFRQFLQQLDVVETDAEWREQRGAGAVIFAQKKVQAVRQALLGEIAGYHQQNPEEAGIPQQQVLGKDEIRSGALKVALDILLQERKLARSGDRIKLVDFVPELDRHSAGLLEKIYLAIGPDVTKPPSLSALEGNTGLKLPELNEQVQALVKAGYLVPVAKNRLYHPQAIQSLASLAQTLHKESDEQGFDAKTFRDRSGIGRNITIEVLEYFDAVGYTRRVGDLRFANPDRRLET